MEGDAPQKQLGFRFVLPLFFRPALEKPCRLQISFLAAGKVVVPCVRFHQKRVSQSDARKEVVPFSPLAHLTSGAGNGAPLVGFCGKRNQCSLALAFARSVGQPGNIV